MHHLDSLRYYIPTFNLKAFLFFFFFFFFGGGGGGGGGGGEGES